MRSILILLLLIGMQENCWSQDTTVKKAINNAVLSTDTSKIVFADTCLISTLQRCGDFQNLFGC